MSFGREVNEACREVPTKVTEAKQTNQELPINDDSMGTIPSEPSYNPFEGEDVERFLGNTPLTDFGSSSSTHSNDPLLSNDDGFLSKDEDFLSKDVELLPDDVFGKGAEVFNSSEEFSNLLKEGWEMDMKFKPVSSDSSSETFPPSPRKTFPTETTTETPSVTDDLATDTFTSREWLPDGHLGSHVDVPYNTMFKNDNQPSSVVDVTSPKFDWEAHFYSQLQLVPPPPSPSNDSDELPPEVETNEEEHVIDTEMPDAPVLEDKKPSSSVKQSKTTKKSAKKPPAKKKRKRKPREKVLPDVFVYVEPRNEDVLMGRGGKSNHHPGNKRYRDEVTNLKKWYRDIEDDKEKTDLSQCLVDYVQSYRGRFLEKNKTGWYIVPNIVARRKASQALREDTDPVKRAAKRTRYLEKKKRTEKEEEAKKKQKKNQG